MRQLNALEEKGTWGLWALLLFDSATLASRTSAVDSPQGAVRGQPKVAELQDNGVLLAALQPPGYGFTWDVSALPEGTHQLLLRLTYGNEVVTSDPVVVNVDHTPPSIVSREPDATAEALPGAAVKVTFSEPVVVSPNALVVKDANGNPRQGGLALSTDRLTLTFTPKTPDVGMQSATVADTIADRAGNRIPAASQWGWEAPLWQETSVVGRAELNGPAALILTSRIDDTPFVGFPASGLNVGARVRRFVPPHL